MQFIKNGPDVPERLLQSHEDGKVVFFCGAGISYPAKLPGFSGLTEKLFEYAGETPDDFEALALKGSLFDTAIGLLENRISGGRKAVRRHLETILSADLKLPGATRTHSALLTLGKCRSGQYRIVTTNFDRLFESVIAEQGLEVPSYNAPLLPVPKSRWNGLVYLHGLLPEKSREDELNRLVLASGDFGLAYLIERWAARFVSELFRGYTVCFVGYSINDPVMRYMMDALAADRLMGETPIESFAFAGYSVRRGEERAKAEWKVKNVTPVLYPDTGGHRYLHGTLDAWAKTYRDGVRGKEAVVARYASIEPTGSTKQDDFVKRMLWALADRSGSPAKLFADLKPSLSWLEALTERRFERTDLARFMVFGPANDKSKVSFSLLERPYPYLYGPLMSLVRSPDRGRFDDIMLHLGRWLASHADDPAVLLKLVKAGGELHPIFASQVVSHLSRAETENRAVATLWSLVIAGRVRKPNSSGDFYLWEGRFLRQGLTLGLRHELRAALTPFVDLDEPYRFDIREEEGEENEDIHEKDGISKLVRWEIVLGIDHVRSLLEGLRARPEWVAGLPDLLPDLRELLRDAMDLRRELGGATDLHDQSYIYQRSISQHEQNRGYDDWTLLIELLRDAWLALSRKDADAARKEADLWRSIPYPVFKRLAFFAAAHGSAVAPDLAVSWLLGDNARWLWSVETQREAIRLLVAIAARLSLDIRDELERTIVAGPPLELLAENIDAERLERARSHEVWLRLIKMRAGGARLGAAAAARLEDIVRRYPEWQPAADDRDEFPFWSSDGEEWRTHSQTPSAEQDLESWLEDNPVIDDLHQTDDWKDRCAKDFDVACRAIANLASRGVWPVDRWQQALQVWSSEDFATRSWIRLHEVTAAVPADIIGDLARSLAWWLESVAKTAIVAEADFFDLIERILRCQQDKDFPLDGEVHGRAINSSAGLAVDALLRHWFRQELEDGQMLKGQFRRLFGIVVSRDNTGLQGGRIVLAGNLVALYRVDPEWTKANILPFFDWSSGQAATSMWQGFLQSPRLYWPLLDDLKKSLLIAPKYHDELGSTFSRQLFSFLTYMALEPGGSYSQADFKNAFAFIPDDGFSHVAETLNHALIGAGEQRGEFIANRLEPFVKRYWRKSKEAQTSRISETLARLCISAEEFFPMVLALVEDWLRPLNNPHGVTHQMSESKIGSRYPEEALAFLDALISDQAMWLSDDLSDCLRQIAEAAPPLIDDARFGRLERLLHSKGILVFS